MMNPEEKAAFLSNRCGKLTASRMADAMSFIKSGAPSADRKRYMLDLVAERATGDSVRHYVTDAMQRGLDLEDEMFDVFVEQTGRDVRRSRFYEHPEIEYFGAHPDREIDDDGLVEGKIPSIGKFVEWKIAGVVPEEHKPQLLAQIACSRKKWVGFVAYCPEMKEERRRLFLAKYVPTAEEIAAVEAAARQFLSELDQMFELFTTGVAA